MNDNISLKGGNWIIVEEAAEYLGVKPITVREWIKKQKIYLPIRLEIVEVYEN